MEVIRSDGLTEHAISAGVRYSAARRDRPIFAAWDDPVRFLL